MPLILLFGLVITMSLAINVDFNRRREPGDSFVVCSKDCVGSKNDPLIIKLEIEVSDYLSLNL